MKHTIRYIYVLVTGRSIFKAIYSTCMCVFNHLTAKLDILQGFSIGICVFAGLRYGS
jgi:hypothetical protein